MCEYWYANVDALKRSFNQTSIFSPTLLTQSALQSSLQRSTIALYQNFVKGIGDQLALLSMYQNMERPITSVGYMPRLQTDVVDTLNPKVTDVSGIDPFLGATDYLWVDAEFSSGWVKNASLLSSAPRGVQTTWTNTSNAGKHCLMRVHVVGQCFGVFEARVLSLTCSSRAYVPVLIAALIFDRLIDRPCDLPPCFVSLLFHHQRCGPL
jgi:hypothetical protein